MAVDNVTKFAVLPSKIIPIRQFLNVNFSLISSDSDTN